MTMAMTTTTKNEELLRAVLKQMPEGVAIVNAENKVTFVNQIAETTRHISGASQLEYLNNEAT